MYLDPVRTMLDHDVLPVKAEQPRCYGMAYACMDDEQSPEDL